MQLLVGAVGATVASIFLLASPAWAHHPEITGSAACDGTVTFTATAWEGSKLPDGSIDPASRTNPEISIRWARAGTVFWQNLPQKPEYHFDAANGFSFTDSFVLPAGAPSQIQLMAKAEQPWANGSVAGEFSVSSVITVPAGCTPPAVPAASVGDATCASGKAIVTLSNTGGTPVMFSVVVDGGAPTTVTVNGGSSSTVPVAVVDGVDRVVSVSAPGMMTVTKTVGYDCPRPPVPSASIAKATCAAGGTAVTLTNTGGTATSFTISIPGRADQVVPVGPGATVVVPVALVDGTSTRITVRAPGMTDVVKTVSYSCAPPTVPSAAIANATCADHGSAVTLTNPNATPTVFTISVPGSPDQTVTVPAGQTVVVPVALVDGTSTPITVRAPGMTDVVKTVSYSCTPPTVPSAAVASATCADHGSAVTLTNPNATPTVFTISVPGSPDQTVTVPAGATVVVPVALAPDTTTPITVRAPGMTDVVQSVTYSCTPPGPPTPPAASVANATCAVGGSSVTLTNPGTAPTVFTISVPGSPDQTVTVPAGQTVVVPVALAADTSTPITVRAPGMADVVQTVTYSCGTTSTPGGPGTVENPPPGDVGGVPGETGGGTPGAPGTVETPPTTVTPGSPAVAETPATPAGALPFTGAPSGLLALLGGVLLALGCLLTGIGNRFAASDATRSHG